MSNEYEYEPGKDKYAHTIRMRDTVKMNAKEAYRKAEEANRSNIDKAMQKMRSRIDARASNGYFSMVIGFNGGIDSDYFEDIARKLYKEGYQVIVEPENDDFNSILMSISWYDESPSISLLDDYIGRMNQ